ncbi:uncharacterized protein RAG0_11954 [Rhynchosporium agropyri]|uniref:Uncharacterized protein n=1 Tax=Rhynchosporium agropyri TaxID=914238 RepID=A0A1E1L6H1_9HELO|nr:uncharacterized protein RAG0_11954 [Rhynchosporium agropyri]
MTMVIISLTRVILLYATFRININQNSTPSFSQEPIRRPRRPR